MWQPDAPQLTKHQQHVMSMPSARDTFQNTSPSFSMMESDHTQQTPKVLNQSYHLSVLYPIFQAPPDCTSVVSSSSIGVLRKQKSVNNNLNKRGMVFHNQILPMLDQIGTPTVENEFSTSPDGPERN